MKTAYLRVGALIGISLAVAANASAESETYVQSIQPFWKALAKECPKKHLEQLAPGDLDIVIARYLDSLPAKRSEALYKAAQPMCVESLMGVSCANIGYIRAFNRFGLTRRVAHIACSSGFVCRGSFNCIRDW
jgi:hypothetical protein